MNVQTLKTESKTSVWNKKLSVTYRPADKTISGRDLTDPYNEPAFYTISKRNLEGAFTLLTKAINEDTTMHDAMELIKLAGVNVRSYCMVD